MTETATWNFTTRCPACAETVEFVEGQQQPHDCPVEDIALKPLGTLVQRVAREVHARWHDVPTEPAVELQRGVDAPTELGSTAGDAL